LISQDVIVSIIGNLDIVLLISQDVIVSIIGNLDIVLLISPDVIVSSNELTDTENYHSVWHQTHDDENNNTVIST
jgi:hypothetical protein